MFFVQTIEFSSSYKSLRFLAKLSRQNQHNWSFKLAESSKLCCIFEESCSISPVNLLVGM